MHKFKDEVAASRTFVFVREIEPLLSAGLIKGGDLDNAIVIYERKMSQESYDKLADVMGVPHMDADQLGYINHKPLVWPNECARHKLLDVIGDLPGTFRSMKIWENGAWVPQRLGVLTPKTNASMHFLTLS